MHGNGNPIHRNNSSVFLSLQAFQGQSVAPPGEGREALAEPLPRKLPRGIVAGNLCLAPVSNFREDARTSHPCERGAGRL